MDVLRSHLEPMIEEMKDRAIELWKVENAISASWNQYVRHYEARYEAQERLTEVMEEARVCAPFSYIGTAF